MLTSFESNPMSTLSQSNEAPKFTKIDAKIPLTLPKKSKLQSLIPAANSEPLPPVTLRTYRLFFDIPSNDNPIETTIQLSGDSTVLEVIKLGMTKLPTFQKTHKISYIFTLYFAKKNGKPKTDLPALDQHQMLKECGDSSLLCLKGEEIKENVNKSTTCSSSSFMEGYRKNSLLMETLAQKKIKNNDFSTKSNFLQYFFCCKH